MELQAGVAAFGSTEVLALVREFADMTAEFAQAWKAYQMLERAGQRGSTDFAANFQKLDEVRNKLRRELLPKIENRVRHDLTSL